MSLDSALDHTGNNVESKFLSSYLCWVVSGCQYFLSDLKQLYLVMLHWNHKFFMCYCHQALRDIPWGHIWTILLTSIKGWIPFQSKNVLRYNSGLGCDVFHFIVFFWPLYFLMAAQLQGFFTVSIAGECSLLLLPFISVFWLFFLVKFLPLPGT